MVGVGQIIDTAKYRIAISCNRVIYTLEPNIDIFI